MTSGVYIRLGAAIEGIYRKDIYELPSDSIRELIINAVMNCSFLQSSHVQVAIYDDRLEITSPGGLMPGVTVERMKEGYSQIRNRALAHAFSYMNLIEGWGYGNSTADLRDDRVWFAGTGIHRYGNCAAD